MVFRKKSFKCQLKKIDWGQGHKQSITNHFQKEAKHKEHSFILTRYQASLYALQLAALILTSTTHNSNWKEENGRASHLRAQSDHQRSKKWLFD